MAYHGASLAFMYSWMETCSIYSTHWHTYMFSGMVGKLNRMLAFHIKNRSRECGAGWQNRLELTFVSAKWSCLFNLFNIYFYTFEWRGTRPCSNDVSIEYHSDSTQKCALVLLVLLLTWAQHQIWPGLCWMNAEVSIKYKLSWNSILMTNVSILDNIFFHLSGKLHTCCIEIVTSCHKRHCQVFWKPVPIIPTMILKLLLISYCACNHIMSHSQFEWHMIFCFVVVSEHNMQYQKSYAWRKQTLASHCHLNR